MAIVSPQNQSGNPGLDGRAQWLGWALTVPFAGLADTLVVGVESRRQAADLQPLYVVEPSVEARGAVLQVYEAPHRRHVAEVVCGGDECVSELARVIGATPRPVRVPEAAGVRLWVLRREPSEAGYRALLAAFPDLPLAYEEWLNFLVRSGRGAEAAQELASVAARDWPPLEKAQFTMFLLARDGDTAARTQAVTALARAWPANAVLQTQAADALSRQRDFPGAASFLRTARRAEPGSLPVLATLSYTLSLAGKSAEALDVAGEAASIAVDSAAADDLRGDVLFLKGDMANAERAYLQGAEKDETAQLGRLFAKAAEAALLQNQIGRADQHMQRFFGVYQKAVPGGIAIVQGLWLWRTGHRAEALRQAEAFPSIEPLFRFLANPAAGGGPAPAGNALQMLTRGRPAEAAVTLQEMIQTLPPLQSSRWEQVLAVTLWEAGQQKEACGHLHNWGLPAPPDEWASATVWPRQLTVHAACLEGSQPDQAALLRQVAKNVSPQ